MTPRGSRRDDRPRETRPDLDDPEVVSVERTATIQADVEQVWRSLSHLDDLADWLGVERDDPPAAEPEPVPVVPGLAARLVEPDGSARHLLVTEVDAPGRLSWQWWHDDGLLSAVEITLEPAVPEADGDDAATLVRVVETLALDGAGSSGLSRVQLCAALDQRWATRTEALTSGLADRLAGRLGAVLILG